ncbi:MAG: glycosyltransferase family 4 protein [Pseudomonadota bacterium]
MALRRIANISENPDPDWCWLKGKTPTEIELQWVNFSTAHSNMAGQASLSRFVAARRLAATARKDPFDVIISHGPWPAAWTAGCLGSTKGAAKHFAFSFNFTELPAGPRRRLMTWAFQHVDEFAVFTRAERQLYAQYFNIPSEKIVLAPWGVAPPLDNTPMRSIEGLYFSALGGEARDYAVLCETARRCPDEKFIAIARPHSFDGLCPPSNLDVRINLPFEDAWAIVYHAEAAIIPLVSRDTPCGIVTLVGGMHLGKAQIVTNAVGVSDYISHGRTGLLVDAQDSRAIANAIDALKANPSLTSKLGRNARRYAQQYCSEAATVDFFADRLNAWGLFND